MVTMRQKRQQDSDSNRNTRDINSRYLLVQSKDNSRLIFKVLYGGKSLQLTYVKDWRKPIIERFLAKRKWDWSDSKDRDSSGMTTELESRREGLEWDEIASLFIAFEAVNSARDYREAINLLDETHEMSYGEVHFWASKLLSNRLNARRAFRIMYSRR